VFFASQSTTPILPGGGRGLFDECLNEIGVTRDSLLSVDFDPRAVLASSSSSSSSSSSVTSPVTIELLTTLRNALSSSSHERRAQVLVLLFDALVSVFHQICSFRAVDYLRRF
jgi:hypothetical protein